MNFLFYVGIIVPTVITISLFMIFIYCWLQLRARKEVLTKKYDPHGKMRSLGLSMNPPLPPTFCLLEDTLLPDLGEDNVAYDVSRSPSTQQDWRGRPLYHTYHDSGISAGLSPSQEHEPRHGLVYRTCPDSGVSGLSLLQPMPVTYQVTRGYCQVDETPQPQLQRVYEDHDQTDRLQQQHYQQQSPHVATLHQSQLQASVHLRDGRWGSRNWNDSGALQNYDCPQTDTTTIHLGEYNLRHSNMHTPATPTLCTRRASMLYQDETKWDSYPHCGQRSLCSDLGMTPAICHDNQGSAVSTEHHAPVGGVVIVSPPVHSHLKQPLTPDATSRLYDLPVHSHLKQPLTPDATSRLYDLPLPAPLPPPLLPSSTAARAATAMKQLYRDSGIMDVGQAIFPGTERPDSQASQSSTTDSEDSGFRSSYCATHRKAVLGKQEHPLLKPLRKTRTKKNHRRSSRRPAGNSQHDPGGMHKPHMTRSPEHLEGNIHNLSVIQHSSTGLDVIPRSLATSQPRTSVTSSRAIEGDYCTARAHDGAGLDVCHNPPVHPEPPATINCPHSPSRNIWARQSVNDTEFSVKQTIDLTDISSHLRRKCPQEVTPYSRPQAHGPDQAGVMEQGRYGGPPGTASQGGADWNLNSYGYSVV